MVLGKTSKVLNKIFSFMFFVNSGDFAFEDVASYYIKRSRSLLPNLAIILNLGIIVYGTLNDKGFGFHRYPDLEQDINADWFLSPFSVGETGSMEGSHLGYLYYSILEHLSNSYLEPPSFNNFIHQLKGRKSLLKKAKTIVDKK